MGYELGRESAGNKAAMRTVVLASADADLRARLRQELTAMRWKVREAAGGAEAIALLGEQGAEAMLLDSVLPDLKVSEFTSQMHIQHPEMELLSIHGSVNEAGARSPRRNELLHALRLAQQDVNSSLGAGESVAWMLAPVTVPQISATERMTPGDERSVAAHEVAAMLRGRSSTRPTINRQISKTEEDGPDASGMELFPVDADGRTVVEAQLTGAAMFATDRPVQAIACEDRSMEPWPRETRLPLPDMVGQSQSMLEMARLIRLVAPRSTTVLIEGETGTGKELIARAVHRLSPRSCKPFVVLNCAAIPESLLEAELFGHTRGAFTGAVQSRMGRIEAAHGGTLFLDEIGEMPLPLQAKMLRFLESGELQRVGDNDLVHVEVRVIAATHEPLQQRANEHAFRLDLYHRLAVFPVTAPALREHMEDVLLLAEHLLGKLGEEMPVKRLSSSAAQRLMEHHWPGNVRELAHVLERATILAEDRREIALQEIRF
jgi:DNA-binding NtrC family response regulator